MKKTIKQFALLGSMVAILILPYFVFAASSPLQRLSDFADNSGYDTSKNDPTAVAGNVVSVFLGLLGVIFVILILYAGYHWMTAAGDEGKVEKAQDTIKRAVIGLIITVGAYAIWNVIYLSDLIY